MNMHQLNNSIDLLRAQTQWKPDLIDLFADVIANSDPAAVIDCVETLGDSRHSGMSPLATALYLSELAPPDEVVTALLVSEYYIEVICLPDFLDVISGTIDWDDDARLRLEYWAVANLSHPRAVAVARQAGHPELAENPRLDAADMMLELTKHITPGALRHAWTRPTKQTRYLDEAEKKKLRRLRGRRRTGKRQYCRPTAAFVERLRAERNSGVTVAELAKILELSPARIYQLIS